MPTDPSRLTSEEARALVAFKREDAGPGLVEARRAAEDEARDLLDGAAGEMTADDLGRLLALFNLDAYRGAPKRWRFTPGFSGAHAQQLVRDLSRLNEAVRSLWRGSLDEALDELDRIMTRRDLPGAGRSFPSMLLYLRDREEFAVLGDAIATGLRNLTGRDFLGANSRGPYLEFCSVAAQVRGDLGLAPQEVDWILSEAARPRSFRGSRTSRWTTWCATSSPAAATPSPEPGHGAARGRGARHPPRAGGGPSRDRRCRSGRTGSGGASGRG